MMKGKIRKMITEEKNKSWKKACSTVESYWVANEAQKQNLGKNENGRQCFNPIPIDKWETYFKGILTENRERYLEDQETELEDMNGIELDKIN